MRAMKGASLKTIVAVWRSLAAFTRHSARFRKEAQQRRRQLVEEFLQDSHQCALQHDAGVWYQRINQLCPKSKREHIHLRSKEGETLSPEDALREIQQYFGTLFSDPTYKPQPLPPMQDVPFSSEDLERSLRALPIRKATLGTVAPAIMWQATASCVAVHLHKELKRLWCQSNCSLPDDWYHSILWLMAKPGKAPRTPSALHPTSLQHPLC